MSETYTGRVEGFSKPKPWKDKYLYSFLVDETWFGCGEVNPTDYCKKGDTVSFEYAQKGNFKNADMKSIKITASQRQEGSSSGTSNSRADYWEGKEQRDLLNDERMAMSRAYMLAKDVVLALLAKDKLPLPKDEKDTITAVLGYIDTIAVDYNEVFLATSSTVAVAVDKGDDEEGGSW